MHEKVSPIRPLATANAMTQAPNKVTPFVAKTSSKYDKKLRYRLFWLLRQYKTAQQQDNQPRAKIIAQHIEELINPNPTTPPIAQELNATLTQLKQKISKLEIENQSLLLRQNELEAATENHQEQDLMLVANHEKIQQRQHQLERLQQHIDSSQQNIDQQCAKFNHDILRCDSLVNLWQDRLGDFQHQANSQQHALEVLYQDHSDKLQQQHSQTQKQTQALLSSSEIALAKSRTAHNNNMALLATTQKQEFNSQQNQIDKQQEQNKNLFEDLAQQQIEQKQLQDNLEKQQQTQQILQQRAQQNLDFINHEIKHNNQQSGALKELLEQQRVAQQETTQQHKTNQQRQLKLQDLINTQQQDVSDLEIAQSNAKQQLNDHTLAQKNALERFETLHNEANEQLATLNVELHNNRQQQRDSIQTNDESSRIQRTQNEDIKNQLLKEIDTVQGHLERLENTRQELNKLSIKYDTSLAQQNQSYDNQQIKLKNLNEKILSSERLQQDQRKTQQALQQQLDILHNESEKNCKLATTLEQTLETQKPQVEKLEQLLSTLPNSLERSHKASDNIEQFLSRAEALFSLNSELLEKAQQAQGEAKFSQQKQQQQLQNLKTDWQSFTKQNDSAQKNLDNKHLAIDDGLNRIDQLQFSLATQIQTLDLVIDDNKQRGDDKELEKRLKSTLKEQFSRALSQRDKGPEIEELQQKQNQLLNELDGQKTKHLNDKHFTENEQLQLNKQLQDLHRQSQLQTERMQQQKNQHQQQIETQNLELKQLQKNSNQQLNQIEKLSEKIGDLNQRRNDFDPSQQLRSHINQLQEQLDYASPRQPLPAAQDSSKPLNWSWGVAAVLLFCVLLSTFQVYQQNQTILRLQGNTGYSASNKSGSLTLEDITLSSNPTTSNKRAHYHSFSWPVQSSDSQAQQITYRKLHNGINIQANTGAPIFAITQGKVIYSDSGIRGYGNVIVIEHEQDLMSVYANTKVNYVKAGDLVEKGQLLGDVGLMSGANQSGLYFEIRHKGIAEDPFLYLSSEG